MEITFTGKSSKISKKEIRNILNWSSQRLMSDKLSQNISVNICFRKKLDNNSAGFCSAEDEMTGRHRKFMIEVNDNKTKRTQIRTLLHEMVHIKQFAKGELRNDYRSSKLCKWMGESMVETDFDYWELPWEVEAYGREEGLYRMYMKKKRLASRADT